MKPTIEIGDRLIPDGWDRTLRPLTVVFIHRGYAYTTQYTYAPRALPLNAPTTLAAAKASPHHASRTCSTKKTARISGYVWEDCQDLAAQMRSAALALGIESHKANLFLAASPDRAADILDHLKAIAAILKETP